MSGLVEIHGLNHRYGSITALSDIDITFAKGGLIGIIGPDGAGKSTLLSLIAGVTKIQDGSVTVFGASMAKASHRTKVYSRVGFMPQGLGQNLYGDLSVAENVRFLASLFGVPRKIVNVRLSELLVATQLAEFSDRRAANLSGGMKQKLGLCAILVHEPDLLILDEPTTGVDPLSRRGFWRLIRDMTRRKADMTVLASTAYMDEAEDFDSLVMMDASRIFANGTPEELKQKAHAAKLDVAYQTLLSGSATALISKKKAGRPPGEAEVVIEARDLTRRFGSFTAVDRINLQIRRGEIYGFIGPNGSGKTTTMKMLAGLLPSSAGAARIFGSVVTAGGTQWRRRLGYMSQIFSLYSELTVEQNLNMHGRLFDLARGELAARISDLAREHELNGYMDQLASDLPIGVRQRLSLAVAVIHQPELLILDEPTSGVDPLAREKLWAALHSLSEDRGTTIFVSTHYLGEAERCDRIALMNEGRLLAVDTPDALIASENADSLEDAFVTLIQDDRGRRQESQLAEGNAQ